MTFLGLSSFSSLSLSSLFMVYPNLACWNVCDLMTNGRIQDCHRLIKEHNLDFLCLLETKLNRTSLSSMTSSKSLRLFQAEASVNNFDCSDGVKIFVLWNSNCISFKPYRTTFQLIHGHLSIGNHFSFFYWLFMFTIVLVID